MGKIILYHGTPDKIVVPKFGGGDDKHDYGGAFTLPRTSNLPKNGRSAARTTQTAGFTSTSWKLPG